MITLYAEKFKQLNDKDYLRMEAVAMRPFHSNTKKIGQVHISPVSIEHTDGVAFRVSKSSSSCMKIYLEKLYSANQTRAMKAEIREKAAYKLMNLMPVWFSDDERSAYVDALKFLSTIE